MKRSIFPLVVVGCFIITFFACSNKPKRARKPVSIITVEPAAKNYRFNQKVIVRVKTQLKDGQLKNTQLFFNNQLLKESSETEFVSDSIQLNLLGNQTFKAIATKTDGLNNTRTKLVSVLSDDVPKAYSYQVVNTFPHLTSSYTQGLEIYRGNLYEGTGETGKSHLYKITLETGQPLQTFKMHKNFFGEGITILNNKIYQLTYHAQKGFIYDLNTFAVLDSFRYHSEQGWGLTNDGTNLIMSDGTNVLTWLSPNDFTIIKKVQVANNKSTINNINELEYINRAIYANVYQTNFIIEIDAQTGKVLSEINLTGIIDLYKTNTIDVLNGIAYDKPNDRLFVTGKWWPKLFEIKLTPLK